MIQVFDNHPSSIIFRVVPTGAVLNKYQKENYISSSSFVTVLGHEMELVTTMTLFLLKYTPTEYIHENN